MSLLLALQTPLDITGSGASSLVFTDVGTALEIFEGSGASSFGFTNAGSALETFLGPGASSFGFTDVGDALETFLGPGASAIILADDGAGFVEGGTPPETPPNGGGWVYRDRDRGKTVRAFQRILQPKSPERRARPAAQEQEKIFAYVSESVFAVSGIGRGSVIGSSQGAGASVARLECRGQGRIEESAADIIRLLLSLDEI